jgi:DNA-binding protein HU-beta
MAFCFQLHKKITTINRRNHETIREEEGLMNKGDLVSAVAKAAGLNKTTAGDAVDAIFENLARAIKKDRRFLVPGFGTFTVRSRKARKGRNPQTGGEISIKASRTVGFKPAPDLKKGL